MFIAIGYYLRSSYVIFNTPLHLLLLILYPTNTRAVVITVDHVTDYDVDSSEINIAIVTSTELIHRMMRMLHSCRYC
uniref:Putative secreted protein n=1 Tax=Anopheles darlingi TaxID=43151 RepID=A0A2M4DDU6_ANODA